MANEHLFTPRLAATSFNAAQGDPDDSIGGFQSSTSIADIESTFTTVTSDRVVIDTGLPAGDITGYWVVFLDTNLNEVREIVTYVEGSNTITFDRDLPSTPLVSDRYWLFQPNGFFASADADICRRRATRYRLGYSRNDTGAILDDVRCYVLDIKAGPLVLEVAPAIKDYPQLINFDVDDLTDDETAPVILADQGGWGDGTQDFRRDRAFDEATRSPFGTPGVNQQKSIRETPFQDRPFWLRLRFDDASPIPLPSQVVFQVFINSDDGVTISSFLVVVDVDGVPETIGTVVDRRLRIGGGARLSCLVTDSVAPNEPVPGRTIDIKIGSGPGSMNAQSATIQEADGEPIRRVYISPTDPGQEGATVVFDFEVT